MTTANIIAEATDSEKVSYSQDGEREFLSTHCENFATEREASEYLAATRAYLTQSGWRVIAFSKGIRTQDGKTVHTAGVDALRGYGPQTSYERHCAETFTGRD